MSAQPPSISIVMPAYNCERFLTATLDSILAQTVTAWECIVVDDGSKDATFAVAQTYADRDARIRVLKQQNGGPCMARNYGYEHVSPSSKYISFMDSDDVWLPDALEKLKGELEAHPMFAGAHGLAEFIDEHGDPLNPGEFSAFGRRRIGLKGSRLAEWDVTEPTDFSVLINGNHVFPPGLWLLRRQFYEKAGLWDSTLNEPGDWDMWLRVSRYGEFRFLNEVILLYRRHTANLGATSGTPAACWRVRCKGFFSPENTLEQQHIAKRSWRAYQVAMVQEKIAATKQQIGKRQLIQAANSFARIPVYAYRYMRGYPTPIPK